MPTNVTEDGFEYRMLVTLIERGDQDNRVELAKVKENLQAQVSNVNKLISEMSNSLDKKISTLEGRLHYRLNSLRDRIKKLEECDKDVPEEAKAPFSVSNEGICYVPKEVGYEYLPTYDQLRHEISQINANLMDSKNNYDHLYKRLLKSQIDFDQLLNENRALLNTVEIQKKEVGELRKQLGYSTTQNQKLAKEILDTRNSLDEANTMLWSIKEEVSPKK